MSGITSPSSPRSGRACADLPSGDAVNAEGAAPHPLVVGTAEVLVDAIRYVAIMLVVLLLLGQLARIAL